jgi:hypothetical protein
MRALSAQTRNLDIVAKRDSGFARRYAAAAPE